MYSDSWLLKIDTETAPGAFLMLNLESGSIRLDKFDYFFFQREALCGDDIKKDTRTYTSAQ